MDSIIISGNGYPGANEFLTFLETRNANELDALVKIIGNNVIFNGVEDTEGVSSGGWIIYNNELLPFETSATGETVVIIEVVTSAAYDTSQTGNFNQILPVWKTRKAKFGATEDAGVVDSFAFNSLTRIIDVLSLNQLLTQATEEKLGLVEIATQVEANTTDNDTHAITAKKLNARKATTTLRGVVELATTSEVLTGTDEDRALTIKAMRDAGYRITKVTYGTAITDNRSSGTDNSSPHNTYTENFKEIFPPSGYTMANLVGFIASIAEAYFGGDTNDNDILYCKYREDSDRITVICNNNQNRANSKFNYTAIWEK